MTYQKLFDGVTFDITLVVSMKHIKTRLSRDHPRKQRKFYSICIGVVAIKTRVATLLDGVSTNSDIVLYTQPSTAGQLQYIYGIQHSV